MSYGCIKIRKFTKEIEQMVRVSDFPQLPLSLSLFEPCNPRARRNEAEFRSLANVKLTLLQQNFIAGQCIGELGDYPDIRFGASGNAMKNRYRLSSGTVNGWISNLKNNRVSQVKVGRPNALDAQGKQEFIMEVSRGKENVDGKGKVTKVRFDRQEITECVNRKSRETKKRSGHLIDTENDEIVLSEKTIYAIIKVCMLKVKV